MKGEYYRAESGSEVHAFDGSKFILQTGLPKRATVIVTPDDLFQKLLARYR